MDHGTGGEEPMALRRSIADCALRGDAGAAPGGSRARIPDLRRPRGATRPSHGHHLGITAPLAGPVSDAYGRRLMLLTGLLLMAGACSALS
jgi:hypothetical protein